MNDVIRSPQVLDLVRGNDDGNGEIRTVHMSIPRFKPFCFIVTSRDGSILFGGVVQNIE